MKHKIGIRREDKNEWEGRVPITPADAASAGVANDFQETVTVTFTF